MNEIDRCDFQINVLKNEEADREELHEVEALKAEIENKILRQEEKLLEEQPNEAYELRTGYIAVFNNYLTAFEQAARYGKYVDMDQGMVNPGFLLGMLVHDLYSVAARAGETIPLSYLGVNNRKWEFSLLLDLITEYRASILQRQFHNFIEGIKFYFEFRQAIRAIAAKLRTDRVIY